MKLLECCPRGEGCQKKVVYLQNFYSEGSDDQDRSDALECDDRFTSGCQTSKRPAKVAGLKPRVQPRPHSVVSSTLI